VTLSVAGAVLDGNEDTAIAADSLTITAGSVGTSVNALDTDVDSLVLNTSGAAYVNEASELTLISDSGLLNLSAGGDVIAQSVLATDDVLITMTGAGNLSVVSVSAENKSVTLNVAGAVVDGDVDGDDVDITASSLSITAASVGVPGNALNTDVGSLVLNTSGSAYMNEVSELVLGHLSAAGHIDLKAGGFVAMGDAARIQAFSIGLTASGMALGELNAQGEVRLDGRSGEIRSRLQAAQTNITADSLVMTGFGVPAESASIALRAKVARVQINTGAAEVAGNRSLPDRQMAIVLQSASQVLHQQVVVNGREFQRTDNGAGQVTWSIKPLTSPVLPMVPGSQTPLTYGEAQALLQLERARRSLPVVELAKPNALINMMLALEEDSDNLKDSFLLEGSMSDGQSSKDSFDFDLWVEELAL
jgi:hypothetical protein